MISWEALKLYFIHIVEIKKFQTSLNILQCLLNPIYKAYFLFLSYVLAIVNQLNVEFQSEETRIHVLHAKVSLLHNQILKNFIIKSKVNEEGLNIANPNNFLPLNQIYFEAKVELLFIQERLVEFEIDKFKTNCLAFYVELCTQIKTRFNFKDPILIFLNNFQPSKVASGKVKSIVKILHYIPKLSDKIDAKNLNSEWRLIPDIPDMKHLVEKESFYNF